MSFLSRFKKVFNREAHITVTFYLQGGQQVTTTGVKKLTTSRTAEGGFASYSIEWHTGYHPSFFSLTLPHISAITAYED